MPVYFMRAGASAAVKIGWANEPVKRMGDLQVGHPEKLSIIRLVEGGRGAELLIHQWYARRRLRGEWFTFGAEMLTDALPPVDEPAPPPLRTPRKPLWCYGAEHLLTLGLAYSAGTGKSLCTLSTKISGGKNHKFFARLSAGLACNLDTAERASEWLVVNWPFNLEWPDGIPSQWAAD